MHIIYELFPNISFQTNEPSLERLKSLASNIFMFELDSVSNLEPARTEVERPATLGPF